MVKVLEEHVKGILDYVIDRAVELYGRNEATLNLHTLRHLPEVYF